MTVSLDCNAAWRELKQHAVRLAASPMKELFELDPGRAKRFSVSAAGLYLDYSKNAFDDSAFEALMTLARLTCVEEWRNAMFEGRLINSTERRAVLHTALRNRSDQPIMLAGCDVMPAIREVLDRIDRFAQAVRDGVWRGHSGSMIKDIVHIGIGGSDLGPRMVCHALDELRHERLRIHFVANVDAHELTRVLQNLKADTTLFVIASKTFTTLETMLNAAAAKDWMRQQGVPEHEIKRHFVAVSTNLEAVQSFGIDAEFMFPFWDWVGGRFSLWSSVGLPIVLQCGMRHFEALLEGAHAMDQHFRHAPIPNNMPILLALAGIWNANILGSRSLSIAPYHHGLTILPSHLQQLEMESNGKSVSVTGSPLQEPAVPAIWGQPGTNGQHAYFQWLHQGCEPTAVDFIAAIEPSHCFAKHHRALLASCFAQSEALMKGKTLGEVEAELLAAGLAAQDAKTLAPHKVFPGNRPSNTILIPSLDPYHLGALIALYEHKVMVQGVIWGINSFDQWGVEWGKVLAGKIDQELAGGPRSSHDASTTELITRVLARH